MPNSDPRHCLLPDFDWLLRLLRGARDPPRRVVHGQPIPLELLEYKRAGVPVVRPENDPDGGCAKGRRSEGPVGQIIPAARRNPLVPIRPAACLCLRNEPKLRAEVFGGSFQVLQIQIQE